MYLDNNISLYFNLLFYFLWRPYFYILDWIFSICLLEDDILLFICNSIFFSRFWNIFTIIILNYFSGRFPISSSFVWFGGHLSCSFICWIFLCLFILFRLLCLGWLFCRLEVCGSSSLWRLLPVGGVRLVSFQDFLIMEACICVLVGGARSLLSGVQ